MFKIVVYSLQNRPSFLVPSTLTAGQIRQRVKEKFGYQGVHLPHSWVAVDPD